jgi:hypothetical protein
MFKRYLSSTDVFNPPQPTIDNTATPFGSAIVTADAGSWTMTTTQVPEPSTLTLLLAAMIVQILYRVRVTKLRPDFNSCSFLESLQQLRHRHTKGLS